jgi:DNA mismatch repair protein MLH1
MLAEYFAMDITPDGEVQSLPHLLKEYTPDLNKLPAFLMRLGPQVRVFPLYKRPTRSE